MSQLSRLTLNIVEDLDDNLPQLASLTQARAGRACCQGQGCHLNTAQCLPVPACLCDTANVVRPSSRPSPTPPHPRRPAAAVQLKELLLIGCYCASRGLSQLTCLSMLDLQPGMEDEGATQMRLRRHRLPAL